MGGFLLVVLLIISLVAGGCSDNVTLKPPRAQSDTSDSQAAQAQASLDGLVAALQSGSVTAAEKVAAPSAVSTIDNVVANAVALRLTGLSLRYVDTADPLTSDERSEFGNDAWAASVELQYAFGGLDTTASRVETSVVFTSYDGTERIVGFGAGDVRTPLWLADRLSVVRRGRTLTAVAAPTPGRYPALVATAVRQVRLVLPQWHGPLVVEVPQTQDELDAAVMADPGEYDNIAAVTTTEDGSVTPGAAVRVFVNPAVFGRLRDRGAQVVMSHESTHVATGATFVSMPTWLLEGFADYVALDHAGVPVSLAARQILARIKKQGPPDGLPTSSDLSPTASGLGATYEEAWLACRFVAQEYGEAKLVAFYYAVSGGQPLTTAFQRVLGTTEGSFVSRWRRDLTHLVGVAG